MAVRSKREMIAIEAAMLLHSGRESEYPRAKRKAVRQLGLRVAPRSMPSNREVHRQYVRISQIAGQEPGPPDPRRTRLAVLWLMRQLLPDRSESLESAMGSRPIIRVWSSNPPAVVAGLRSERGEGRVEVESETAGSGPATAAVLVDGAVECRLVFIDPADSPSPAVRERGVDAVELARRLAGERPGVDLEAELEGLDPTADRFEAYRRLLAPLEELEPDPATYPQVDLLYHSLQVFDLARIERPFDEEFLTAALLHEVGQSRGARKTAGKRRAGGADARQAAMDAVGAALRMLDGLATRRTLRLIALLASASAYRQRQLAGEEKLRLEAAFDFHDLLLLAECDEAGRRAGVPTPSIEEAVQYLRSLDDESYLAAIARPS